MEYNSSDAIGKNKENNIKLNNDLKTVDNLILASYHPNNIK